MQNCKHGGDIYRNEIKYDFSVNINPLGIPDSVKNALYESVDKSICYPDIYSEALIRGLKEKLHDEAEFTEGEIIVGNGASELFVAIVHAADAKKVGIAVPSFYGYEHAAGVNDAEIVFLDLDEKKDFEVNRDICSKINQDIDLLFLANPNNPTGKSIKEEVLLEIVDLCARNNILLVLDECFIEFSNNSNSFVSKVNGYDNIIVVRAYTKIFSIPGVRLGYLVTGNKMLADKIRRQLPEWNVSIFAQEAGVVASGERAFIEKTREYVKKEREYLINEINRICENGAKIKVISGEVNYIFLHTQLDMYNKLLERKILIRDCSNFRGLSKGYYRIAVRTHEENCKLIKELEDIWEKDRK